MVSDVALTQAQRGALQDLRENADLSERTQERLSSGKKINTVVDDAVNYFKAKALEDRAKDFDDLTNGIGQAITHLEVTLEAIDAIESLLGQMKGTLEAARSQSAAERKLANESLQQLGQQIVELTEDASYSGANMINNTALGREVLFGTRSNSKMDLPGLNFLDGGRAKTEAYDSSRTLVLYQGVVDTGDNFVDDLTDTLNNAGTDLTALEQRAINARQNALDAWQEASDNPAKYDVTTAYDWEALTRTTGLAVSARDIDLTLSDFSRIMNGATFEPTTAAGGTNVIAAGVDRATAVDNDVSQQATIVGERFDLFIEAYNQANNGVNGVTTADYTTIGEFLTGTVNGGGPATGTTLGTGAADVQNRTNFANGFIQALEERAARAFDVQEGGGNIGTNSYENAALFIEGFEVKERTRIATEVQDAFDETTADDRLFNSISVFDREGSNVKFRLSGLLVGATSLTAVGPNNSALTVISETIKRLDDAIDRIRGHAQNLGSYVAILQTRETFTENYTTYNVIGSEKFILADLNQEGANLVALQTRQQLALQALSVAGQQQRAILTLLQ